MSDELWTEENARELLEFCKKLPFPDMDYVDLVEARRWQYLTNKLVQAYYALAKVANLSNAERGFVQTIAESPRDADIIDIFADWLEDKDRPEGAKRMRKVPVRDGDVVVYHVGDSETFNRVRVEGLYEFHKRKHPDADAMVLPSDVELGTLRVNPGDTIVVRVQEPPRMFHYQSEPAIDEEEIRRLREQFENNRSPVENNRSPDVYQQMEIVVSRESSVEPDWLVSLRERFPDNEIVVIPAGVEVETTEGM